MDLPIKKTRRTLFLHPAVALEILVFEGVLVYSLVDTTVRRGFANIDKVGFWDVVAIALIFAISLSTRLTITNDDVVYKVALFKLKSLKLKDITSVGKRFWYLPLMSIHYLPDDWRGFFSMLRVGDIPYLEYRVKRAKKENAR